MYGKQTGTLRKRLGQGKRIAEGSGEKMRKPGTAGAPTAKAFRESMKTALKRK
jgi:hypothetical protein